MCSPLHQIFLVFLALSLFQSQVTVDARGVGTFGPCPLLNFPNQNGELGRRLGSDEDSDRRVPRCSHVATDELEIASLGNYYSVVKQAKRGILTFLRQLNTSTKEMTPRALLFFLVFCLQFVALIFSVP